MPVPLEQALARVRELVLSDDLARAVSSGRRRGGEQPQWRRVVVRPVDLRSGRHLQSTAYDDTQAHTRNAAEGAAAAELVDELLALPFGNWHVETSARTLQLRVTKRGDAQLHESERDGEAPSAGQPHDRVKQRALDPADAWLVAVGISGADGRVKASRRDKHRQVEQLCRQLAAVVDDALGSGRLRTPTSDDPLRVVDLGCGNAYLTFAAYRWLTVQRGLPVTLTGVDLKQQARERNAELAQQLDATGLRFVEAGIAAVELEPAPEVVLALHACDTATDDALARAVRWQAPVVLAAPCCHHHLQAQLSGQPAPAPYGLLTRHNILRERLADALTDTMRAALLRLHGYRVDVVEFVDSAHTPRNALLRAVRTGPGGPAGVREDYDRLVAEWRVSPRLAELIGEPPS